MALTFADTHNMIAYLTKSNASEGFDQIIDFLNASVIKYALTPCKECGSSSKFYMYPRFLQLMIRTQVGNLSSYTTKYSSPTLTQKVFANMRKVGMGFSRVDTPLFDGMLVPQQAADDVSNVAADDVDDVAPTPPPSLIAQPSSPPQQQQPLPPSQHTTISMELLNILLETCTILTRRVENLEQDKIAQALEITKLKQMVRRLEKRNKVKASGLKRLKKVGTTQRIESSADTIKDDQEDSSKQEEKIANIDAYEDVTLEEVATVTKDAKVAEENDDEPEPSELKEVIEVVTTAKLVTKVVTSVVTTAASTIIAAPSAARRRKGDKQAHIEQDKAYARELEVELNKNINWDDVIEQVKRKEKEDNAVLRYQALKRKPQTEAQASKNMMVYLKNMAGFKMDFFRGMSYDAIRLIFKKHFNYVMGFLEKSEAELEEEASRELKRKTKSLGQQAVKKQNMDEEATPLALEVPVVDYQIHTENNKPYYKIIRADGTHQLFLTFLSLLKNFDREDLEMLWQIVQEKFASSKPKNFSDDFLLTILKAMFEKPNVEAQIWKSQRGIHGLEKVKS
uniref:Uncharacterized protein n=1 Tax=Tanacetum cinerariifolium TaxID=118510 RepID=A0A6L2KMD8_TANCI|nr:hypothetical protein [Tanacetum cinerariifolium]